MYRRSLRISALVGLLALSLAGPTPVAAASSTAIAHWRQTDEDPAVAGTVDGFDVFRAKEILKERFARFIKVSF